jgi:glycosyltransferase involved in cell wall biosynthesis
MVIMKIGIDARFWNQTGVGRYTRNLVRNLLAIDKKHEYVLFVRKADKREVLNTIKKKNVRIAVADINWHSLSEQIIFPSILNQENIDLMHFPYFSVPLFYRKPYVITIHDLIIDHFSTGQATTLPLPLYKSKKLGYKLVIKNAANHALAIIVPSEATKMEVVDHLKVDPNKVYITHEGSEIISNNAIIKDNKKKYFLYVGNAYPHKNLESLLKAFKELEAKFKDLDLYMVGGMDYFYKKIKQQVIDMKLHDHIIFTGPVSDKELSDLYKNALALIVPSYMEGFGLPALEAISNKCLVIASHIPAIYEICKDDAIYFDPFNTHDMTEKISEVYKSGKEKFKTKIENAYKRSQKFSWKKTAIETLKIYESSLGLRQSK